MTIDPELLAVMTQTIVVENIITTPNTQPGNVPPVLDGYGRHYINSSGTSGSSVEYGPAITYKCRLESQDKVIPSMDGRPRISSGRAYLAGYYPELTTECKVTLPGEVQLSLKNPVVMYVEHNYDEDGLNGYNSVLHFE